MQNIECRMRRFPFCIRYSAFCIRDHLLNSIGCVLGELVIGGRPIPLGRVAGAVVPPVVRGMAGIAGSDGVLP
jgi:hypothetical protein